MKVNKKWVIRLAGFGTRFLPATKAVPKEMLPIVDKPTIQYIVEEAIASGIEDLLIITSRGKDFYKIILIRHMSLKRYLNVTASRKCLMLFVKCRIK